MMRLLFALTLVNGLQIAPSGLRVAQHAPRLARSVTMCAPDGKLDPEDENAIGEEWGLGLDQGLAEDSLVDLDMSQLQGRIASTKDNQNLEKRLEALEHAWVLVFDADTDEEAVYSMEMQEEEGAPVVLAFECDREAKRYAQTLKEEAEGEATVQALDVAALVITSREADFLVGVVFKGDLEDADSDAATQKMKTEYILGGTGPAPPDRLSLSITIVPDNLFEGRSSADFLDPENDPVWVLVHDEGTADAQFFSMTLNGTQSIVCFKDAESAERCSTALRSNGTAMGAAACSIKEILLEDLLEAISEEDEEEELEVCLVDEVVETLIESNDENMIGQGTLVAADADDEILGTFGGAEDAGETTAAPRDVRAMLDRLYEATDDDAGEEGASED